MARKISFINYKGGVGKTSLVVNIAACLARMGRRVLVVDVDPQSNSSVWLMRLDRWNTLAGDNGHGKSLMRVFMPGDICLLEAVHEGVIRDRQDRCVLPGLDLVPTTFRFIDLEHEVPYDRDYPPYLMFHEQLVPLEESYDYIFFDCPPNVLRGSECALFASDEVIVPANPDALSLIGLTLLTEKLESFNARVRGQLPAGRTGPQIRGLVYNGVKMGVNIDVPTMRIKARLNQFREQGRVHNQARVYGTMVRDAIIVRRAVTLGLPLVLLGSQPGAEGVLDDYIAIAKELDKAELIF